MKKNIIITILVLIVLGLSGFIVWNEIINKEVKENNKKETEVIDFDKDEAKKLLDKYLLTFEGSYERNNYINIITEELEKGLSDDYKLYLALTSAGSTNIDYTCEEAFPNVARSENGQFLIQTSNFTAGCYNSDDEKAPINVSDGNSVLYKDVDKLYKKLFGEDKVAPKENNAFMGSRYGYSSKFDAYIKLSCECGGTISGPGKESYIDITSAKEDDNKLEITFKYAVFEPKYDDKTETTSYCIEEMCIVTEDTLSLDSSLKELYEKAKDKVDEYKFTFNKENDGYYFVKSEKVD